MAFCGECCGALRAEFALERFVYKHEAAAWSAQFARSWIVKSQPVYLGVRCVFAVVMCAVLIWSLADMAVQGDWNFWWIYLTHWTLLVECIYLLFAAYTTFMVGSGEEATADSEAPGEDATVESESPEERGKSRWWVIATWVLHDIAFPGSFLVFVLYWGLVFSPPLTNPLTPLTHGLNFLVMLVDAVLSSQPIYFMHGLYFVLYGLLYVAFTVFFHFGRGTNQDDEKFIYASIDWDSNAAGSAILTLIVLFIVCPLMYLMLWTVVYVRTRKSSQVARIPMAEASQPAQGVDSNL